MAQGRKYIDLWGNVAYVDPIGELEETLGQARLNGAMLTIAKYMRPIVPGFGWSDLKPNVFSPIKNLTPTPPIQNTGSVTDDSDFGVIKIG